MTKKEAYAILNVPEKASLTELEEAFSKLILQYKPEEAPAMFMKIHEAYHLLTGSNVSKHGNSIIHTIDFFAKDGCSDSFAADEWDQAFEQMDHEYDIMRENEEKKQKELKRKQEEKTKKQEEKKKKKQERSKKSLEYKWDVLLGQTLLLFLFYGFLVEMNFVPNIVLSGMFLFYKTAVIFFQRTKHNNVHVARIKTGFICVIFLFLFAENYSFLDELHFDLCMLNYCTYLTITFVSCFGAIFHFTKNKLIK